MCMLFGFSADKRYNIEKILKEFLSNSKHHPDGWGIGFYDNDNKANVYKEAVPAYKSKSFSTLGKVESDLFIAHIRKATRGGIEIKNTHPFMNKKWIFAHNGSIKDIAFKGYKLKTKGETDSEKAFEMMKLLAFEKDIELIDKVKNIETCISRLSKHGKVNLLFTDGERLYIHSNTPNTLYTYEKDGLVCVATKPLKRVKNFNRWKQVPLNRLIIFQSGHKIYTGEKHPFSNKPTFIINEYRLTKSYNYV